MHPAPWLVLLSDAIKQARPETDLRIYASSPWIQRSCLMHAKNLSFHIIRAGGIPGTLRAWPERLPINVLLHYAEERLKVRKELRSFQPDLVHAHGTERWNALAALDSPFPAIITMQGILSDLATHYPDSLAFKLRVSLERNAVKRGQYFIAKTKRAREYIQSLNTRCRIIDIENPMNPVYDTVQPQYAQGGRIMFVGAIVPAKGIPELLEAVRNMNNIKLLIIGEDGGRYAAALKKEYAGNYVEWLGARDAAYISQVMETVDMLVLPSHMENSPNVVSEAMCAGLPVIATRVGGIPHMIDDGKTGILVEPHNIVDLKVAIVKLLDNPLQRRSIGIAAREVARRRFNVAMVAEQTWKAYEEVLNSSGKSSPLRMK